MAGDNRTEHKGGHIQRHCGKEMSGYSKNYGPHIRAGIGMRKEKMKVEGKENMSDEYSITVDEGKKRVESLKWKKGKVQSGFVVESSKDWRKEVESDRMDKTRDKSDGKKVLGEMSQNVQDEISQNLQSEWNEIEVKRMDDIIRERGKKKELDGKKNIVVMVDKEGGNDGL
ncbi:hypothetical protein DITRI_Ditri19aG0131100 [Diplodiscus trichospermus]